MDAATMMNACAIGGWTMAGVAALLGVVLLLGAAALVKYLVGSRRNSRVREAASHG